MARYLIIGCGGSGKSTLAKALAGIFSIPYIDTDSMYWQRQWKLLPDADVVRDLPLESDSWAMDGNFVDFRDHVWAKADCIVWLNYSRLCILSRVTKRNLGWWISKRATWSGNRMPLSRAVSGIKHSFRQYSRLQKTFPVFLREVTGKQIMIFHSPKACDSWLGELKGGK